VGVTLQQLAALVRGTVHGDAAVSVETARPLQEAGPGTVTFLDSERNVRFLRDCRAAVVLMPPGLAARRSELLGQLAHPLSVLEVDDPLGAFVTIVQHLHPPPPRAAPGIDPRAAVDAGAQLGEGCTIGPFVSIGAGSSVGARCHLHAGVTIGRNCRLGDDVELFPGVVVYDGCVLGHRVILHANAVIGADGFGYRHRDGRNVKIPQFGSVEIGDDVEIGAGTAVDRGTFGATVVGAGTKIDNLVQIGHNCRIGRHNLVVSQVGIAGSCSTGDYVVIAGQVGVADHVHIGDGAVVGAKSGLHRDVGSNERVLGAPAKPESEEKRILLSLEKLPELRRDVRQIKQHLGLAG
jgi:UDP-3-O-[3-hydroxymyristoyl] glucosamine N-acyltransferase